MEIITRSAAKAAKLKRYFTGEPCSKGHVAERSVSGHSCVECKRLRARDPKVRESRREYMAAHQRKWRQNNRTRWKAIAAKRKDADTIARRALRAKNPELGRAALRRSFQKHKAKRMAETRAWKQANPEQARAIQKAGKANRRALERSAEGSIKKSDVLRLFDMQQGRCAALDCQVDISVGHHLDHIIPLSRGGSNMPDNAQLLCKSCNLSKKDKLMCEWAAWKAELTPVCSVGARS